MLTSDISLMSHDTPYRLATWAFYIRTPSRIVKESGQFKEYVDNPTYLERKALANALYVASTIVDLREHKLVIYSEVEEVHIIPRTKKGHIRAKNLPTAELIRDYIDPYLDMAKSYEVHKVKAHSKGRTRPDAPVELYMNHWCDRACHRLLRKLRKGK